MKKKRSILDIKKYQKEYQKKYSQKPEVKEKRRKSQHLHRQTEKYKEQRNLYERERRKQDPIFSLKGRLRRRVYDLLSGNVKSAPTETLLGCSFEEARDYLESMFQEGMNWDNRHEWHIDHVIPCSSFDLSDPAEQKKCFNYTNLQPLWVHQNLKKGVKLVSYSKLALI